VTDPTPSLLRSLKRHGLPCRSLERVRPGGHVWRAIGEGRAWSVQHAERSEAPAWRATARWLLAMNRLQAPILRLWRPPKGEPRAFVGAAGVMLVGEWERGRVIAEVGWDAERAGALGTALATLHRHSLALKAPRGARRYDGAWANALIERFGSLAARAPLKGLATPQEWVQVMAGLRVAAGFLEAAWQGGPVAMIHADVHAGNVLQVEGERELRFIDVGRVGLGPLALDVAFALLEHPESTRWPLLRSYQAGLGVPLAFERLDTPFRLLAAVDNLTFLASIEQEHTFIAASWPDLVATAQALSDLAGVG
jgi:hypothetical protein